MVIGILSFRSRAKHFTYEEKRLEEEGKKRGHDTRLLRSEMFVLSFDGKGATGVRLGNKSFPKLDVLIPRVTVLKNIQPKIAMIKHLELMHVPIVNGYESILKAKSKLNTLQILSHYSIPVVKTAVVNNVDYLHSAIKYIGQFPIIMKTAFGSLGEGVALLETERGAKSTYQLIMDNIESTNTMLLQEYIAESKGKDIRIFIAGGKFIAAMERSAAEGDFRSNVGQGGEGSPYEPTKEEINLAIRATKALNLEVTGVDIIQTKHGPAIMEVNANPGFEELEEVTSVNVAEAIIRYSVKFAKEYVPRW